MAHDVAAPATALLRELLEEQWRRHVAELVRLSIEMCDTQPDDRGPRDDDALRSTIARVAAQRLSLRDIEAALARIDSGRYGWCEQCGGAILAERLEVLPQTRYCAACQPRQRLDRRDPAGGRVAERLGVG